MMAKPCLALILIPLILLYSSLDPFYALYFLITVLYMHYSPSNSDLSFCSCKPGYMLFLELFDTVLMKSTKIHSSLQTLTHNLTPPFPQKLGYPLTSPSFPLYLNSIPIYPIIYISLETHQPVERSGRRWHGHPLSPQLSLY